MKKLNESEKSQFADKVVKFIMEVVSSVPETDVPTSASPKQAAYSILRKYRIRIAGTDFIAAVPGGPISWWTMLPALIGIWRMQAQMVAEIAATFGKTRYLHEGEMLYCLFCHTAAHLFRDLVIRTGQRALLRRASLRILQRVALKLGYKFTQRLIGRTLLRTIPLIGAVGIGAYAWFDTNQVGKTAIDLFSKELSLSADPPIEEIESADD